MLSGLALMLLPGIGPRSICQRMLPGERHLLGLRRVVLTGALDFTIDRLMKHLGIDDYVANRLEFVNGYATGRVLPPVMASATLNADSARVPTNHVARWSSSSG